MEKPRLKELVRELKDIEIKKRAIWSVNELVSPAPLLTRYGAVRVIVELGKQEERLLRERMQS